MRRAVVKTWWRVITAESRSESERERERRRFRGRGTGGRRQGTGPGEVCFALHGLKRAAAGCRNPTLFTEFQTVYQSVKKFNISKINLQNY